MDTEKPVVIATTREEIAAVLKDVFEAYKTEILSLENKKFLREIDVATMFKVSIDTVRNWARQGIISQLKVGGAVRYDIEEVRRFIEDSRK